jgi:hypothetical protein
LSPRPLACSWPTRQPRHHLPESEAPTTWRRSGSTGARAGGGDVARPGLRVLPRRHTAFKHIGPARKLCAEQGQRTIFSFRPLLNPVRPSAQLIGVPRPELCASLAGPAIPGVRRGLVVRGRIGRHGRAS